MKVNQSLESFIKKHFTESPDRYEVAAAIKALLLGIPLTGKNIKAEAVMAEAR